MGKKSLVIGAAIGYVLGARAGRGRYDQIVAAFSKVRNDPKVKSTVDQAQTAAVDTARSAAASAKDAAASAKDAVASNPKVQDAVQTAKDKLPGSGSSGSGSSTPTTATNSGQPGHTTAATPRTGTGTGTTTLPSTPPLNTPGSASTTPRP